MLRRKYKLPTVSFDVVDYEISTTDDMADEIQKCDEMTIIRRELAFLAKTYREAMVRYYMNGESVEDIAKALSIPKGTVLSRLDTGRKNMRKGVESMEKFSECSYQPQKLCLGINGRYGFNYEPFSLIGSPIESNILIFAYEKPDAVTELANGLGIATAYIEPIVDKLVSGELMKKTSSGKVYTDFPISFEADRIRNIDLQIKMAADNFIIVWKLIDEGLSKIKSLDFMSKFSMKKAALLESYFAVDTLEMVFHNIKQEFLGDKAIEFSDCPDRSNGGKWYASGACLPADYDMTKDETSKYGISGRLQSSWDDYMGRKYIALYDYDTYLGHTHYAYENFKYKIRQPDLLKLLFAIYTNKTSGTDQKYLELIPELEEIGLVTTSSKKAEVDIPILYDNEFKQVKQISDNVIKEIEQSSKAAVFDLLEKGKSRIPPQINAPEYQKYSQSTSILTMRFIFTTIEKGLFLKDIKHKCSAIVMVIGDEI